jgi:hypothetical protein
MELDYSGVYATPTDSLDYPNGYSTVTMSRKRLLRRVEDAVTALLKIESRFTQNTGSLARKPISYS